MLGPSRGRRVAALGYADGLGVVWGPLWGRQCYTSGLQGYAGIVLRSCSGHRCLEVMGSCR
eukprot:7319019-Pyramimonas_sp.AAC.1